MIGNFVTFIILLQFIFQTSNAIPDSFCVPGQSYFNGCTTCRCRRLYTGKTLTECESLPPGQDCSSPLVPPPKSFAKQCVAGKIYFNGCAHCFCASNQGQSTFLACPLISCLGLTEELSPPDDFWKNDLVSSNREENAESDEKRQCIEGKSYYDGCNYCGCSRLSNGRTGRYCTRIACDNPQPAPPDFWLN